MRAIAGHSFSQEKCRCLRPEAHCVWTLPNDMAANANVQVLTSDGTFAAQACVNLH
jgi:hypothetical protein